MSGELLNDFLIIFTVSTIVAVIFHYFKMPTIIGFIISGVIVGPSGFGLISDAHTIHQIAEMGLILLLFSIGIEFSLSHLMRMKRLLFGGGLIQFSLTTAVGMGAALFYGLETKKAFLIGTLLALSSTAVFLKALHQRRELTTPHGNLSVGILLFQDMMVLPLMLLVPMLSESSNTVFNTQTLILSGLKGLLLIAAVIIGSRYVIPMIFKIIAQQGRELFIIAVTLLIVFATWASHELGLSLALGAFVAGIMISESPYGQQATADILAWREPLVAVFFASIGMLLDLNYVLSHPLPILLAGISIFVIKAFLNSITGNLVGVAHRSSIVAGLMLSQVGEFSFILADSAAKAGVLNSVEYQFILSVTALSLLASPLIIKFTPLLAPGFLKTNILGHLIERTFQERMNHKESPAHHENVRDHVILVGYGNNGRNLSKALSLLGIPYRIIEINAKTFEEFKDEPIIFGDGGKPEILEKAGIQDARTVVVTINDPVWIQKVITAIKTERPDIRLVVRLQYFADCHRVEKLETIETVIAEAETAKQVVARVLNIYDIPKSEIDVLIN